MRQGLYDGSKNQITVVDITKSCIHITHTVPGPRLFRTVYEIMRNDNNNN